MIMDNHEDTNENMEQKSRSDSGPFSLTDSMSNSINSEVVGLISNIGEVGIDAALNEGILKEVPFISTAVSIYRIGRTIKERSLLEKMWHFVKEMNAGCADESEREKRAKCFKNDEVKRAEELKHIIILLDRYTSTDRADWLAKVYLSYLEKKITWTDVLIYSECIDKIILEDLYYLDFYVHLNKELPVISDEQSIAFLMAHYGEKCKRFLEKFDYDSIEEFSPKDRFKIHTDRLISAGLVERLPIPINMPSKIMDGQVYVATRTGIIFMELLLGYRYIEDQTVFRKYYFKARFSKK